MNNLPWARCFKDPAHPELPAQIRLRQVGRKTFELESSLRYVGPTGVPALPKAARTLHPEDLGPERRTDLASVPAPLRWLVGTYGVHTPAALLHDRLIGPTRLPGVSSTEADRFFRFMLRQLGVRWLRRWMMWSAVAFGTRWRAGGVRRATLVVWVVLAVVGMASFVAGAAAGSWAVTLTAAVAPLLAAALWGRQYGAALVAALTAIWVLPPTVLGAVGYAVYVGLEGLLAVVLPRSVRGDEPIRYQHF